jgi:hypothetical protein
LKHIFKIKLLNDKEFTIESDTNSLNDISLKIIQICVENNSQVISLNELTASHRNIK